MPPACIPPSLADLALHSQSFLLFLQWDLQSCTAQRQPISFDHLQHCLQSCSQPSLEKRHGLYSSGCDRATDSHPSFEGTFQHSVPDVSTNLSSVFYYINKYLFYVEKERFRSTQGVSLKLKLSSIESLCPTSLNLTLSYSTEQLFPASCHFLLTYLI